MVFSKILFAAVLGLTVSEEAVVTASSNSTENATDVETLRELTETDVDEFIKSADKDSNSKVNLEEVNKLFQFDISDDELKKMFQGVEAEDLALFIEQKNNMSTMFAAADTDKDTHLSKEEILASEGFKSFLQTAVNDEDGGMGGEFDEDGEGGEFGEEGDMGEDEGGEFDEEGEGGEFDEEGMDEEDGEGGHGGSSSSKSA